MNKSQLELQNKRLKAKLDAILKQKENAGIKLQFADIKVSLEMFMIPIKTVGKDKPVNR